VKVKGFSGLELVVIEDRAGVAWRVLFDFGELGFEPSDGDFFGCGLLWTWVGEGGVCLVFLVRFGRRFFPELFLSWYFWACWNAASYISSEDATCMVWNINSLQAEDKIFCNLSCNWARKSVTKESKAFIEVLI